MAGHGQPAGCYIGSDATAMLPSSTSETLTKID